ncbi:MAG: AAA family ATPase, partial [Micromonosporaceae bacterium]|nr:AAA family ATPase [Micromonosporaceae bacterium]
MLPRTLSLVERDGELTTLMTALRRTPGGAVIEGEPGIGKTRLVRQALAEAALPGWQILVGHARPAREAYPLGPVVEALASAELPAAPRLSPLTGALREVLPDRSDTLPPAPPPSQDPVLARHRLLRATAELLGGLGPAVLVLEDLHWADDATLELLGMVGARPPRHMSLVLTYRACDLTGDARLAAMLAGPLSAMLSARIRLGPLSPRGVALMAAETLGDAASDGVAPTLPEAVAELLCERSGGVPL